MYKSTFCFIVKRISLTDILLQLHNVQSFHTSRCSVVWPSPICLLRVCPFSFDFFGLCFINGLLRFTAFFFPFSLARLFINVIIDNLFYLACALCLCEIGEQRFDSGWITKVRLWRNKQLIFSYDLLNITRLLWQWLVLI